MSILSMKQFSFCYEGSRSPAVESVDLELQEGDFAVLFGPSGSGKSTLLRSILKDIAPKGSYVGKIATDLNRQEIAYVFQDPNTQLFCHTVLEDLVFHMENLGFDQSSMKKRVAETVHYFGILHLMDKSPDAISVGQKQLVVLCSALMLRPKLLILDEPLSQLDPISSRNLIDMLHRINQDFGVSILLSSHLIDDLATYANRLFFMEKGKIRFQGTVESVLTNLYQENEENFFLPSMVRLSHKFKMQKLILRPKEFRKEYNPKTRIKVKQEIKNNFNDIFIKGKNIFFTYENQVILKNLKFEVFKGEKILLLGANGAGKSTFLKMLAGILRPDFGSIRSQATNTAFLPQNLHLFFRFDTVEKELFGWKENWDEHFLKEMGLYELLQKHPYDLSEGERSKIALTMILHSACDFILLDEPTKGLDPQSKEIMLNMLKNSNATIICSSHDLTFAAELSDRIFMLFDGSLAFDDNKKDFFMMNQYYTTAIQSALKTIDQRVILLGEIEKIEF